MDAKFRVRNGNPNGWPIAVALDNGVLYCSVFTVHEKRPCTYVGTTRPGRIFKRLGQDRTRQLLNRCQVSRRERHINLTESLAHREFGG